MPRILISYRREDTSAYAGRLYDGLTERYGEKQVFMDISTLQAGVDFVAEIEHAVAVSDVVLVVIGKHWLTVSDAEGRRRLDKPEDFVRLEVASGLNRGVRLIPVLVDGATMPTSEVLPEALKALSHHNAIELSDTRWRYDLSRLISALDSNSSRSTDTIPDLSSDHPRSSHWTGLARSDVAFTLAAWCIGAGLAEALYSIPRLTLPANPFDGISVGWLLCGALGGTATALCAGRHPTRIWLVALASALVTAGCDAIVYSFRVVHGRPDLLEALRSGASLGAALTAAAGALVAMLGHSRSTSPRWRLVAAAAIGAGVGFSVQWQMSWEPLVWWAGVAVVVSVAAATRPMRAVYAGSG